MADAPFCNVDVATPGGQSVSHPAFSMIPPNATLQQAIKIINNNFNRLVSANFVENKALRVTAPVTITDPNSGAEFVFNQINRMVLVDPKTGSSWVWQR